MLTGVAGQVSLGLRRSSASGPTSVVARCRPRVAVVHLASGAGLAAAAIGAVVGPLARACAALSGGRHDRAVVLLNYVFEVWRDLTGGTVGRSTMPLSIFGNDLLYGVEVFGRELNANQAFWFANLALLVMLGYAARNVQRTRIGRAFLSVRERDLAAAVAGIPAAKIKTAAFVMSSFYAGVAGALLAAYQSYVLPTQWGLALSIQYVAMIVIGGLGSVAGAVVGALFVAALPEIVKSLTGVFPFIAEKNSPTGGITVELVSQLLYGLLIVVILVFEPAGLMGIWRRFKSFWLTWPWSY